MYAGRLRPTSSARGPQPPEMSGVKGGVWAMWMCEENPFQAGGDAYAWLHVGFFWNLAEFLVLFSLPPPPLGGLLICSKQI